jgi:hypothetical protein
VDAARRVVRQLRRDLVDLEAEDFIAAWVEADSDARR